MSLAVRIVARSEPTKTLRANDLFTEARGMEYLARVKLGKIDGRCRNDLGQGRNRLAGALAFQLSRRFSVVVNEERCLRAWETGYIVRDHRSWPCPTCSPAISTAAIQYLHADNKIKSSAPGSLRSVVALRAHPCGCYGRPSVCPPRRRALLRASMR